MQPPSMQPPSTMRPPLQGHASAHPSGHGHGHGHGHMHGHGHGHGEGFRPPPAPLVRDGFRSNGWVISTVKGPIIADRDVAAFRKGLGEEGIYGLPEMLFNQSQVTLLHEASGVCISLNAQDALREWRQEALPALQVSTATAWQSARRQEIAQQKAVQLEWDWTYTTPFCGTVLRQKGGTVTAKLLTTGTSGTTAALVKAGETTAAVVSTSTESGGVSAGGAAGSTTVLVPNPAAAGTALVAATLPPLAVSAPVAAAKNDAVPGHERKAAPRDDGAAVQGLEPDVQGGASQPAGGHADCSTGCTVARSGDGAAALPALTPVAVAVPAAAAAPAPVAVAVTAEGTEEGVPSWQPCTEQIDKGLLMERDAILFFDEVPLYESDLDDNGVCQLTAKLRVMPKCWLVLLRLWIRVDGSLVRLRETRLFCRTDQAVTRGTVLREVRHMEGTFKELRAAGAPDEGPAYADAEAASSVFLSVAPIGHKLFRLEKLQLQ